MRAILSVFILVFISNLKVYSQHFNGGLLPELSLSYKWTDKIQQTLKIESAHIVYKSDYHDIEYNYERTDVQFFLQGRLSPFFRISGGYLYRFNGEGDNSNRFIQQASFLQRRIGLMVGHRLRLEQSPSSLNGLKWRYRYRLSAEVPIEGQSLDEGEYYLILSGEPIYSMQNRSGEIETRIISSLGYLVSNASKLELGIDYRIQEIFNHDAQQNLWLNFGWYYTIPNK